LNLDLRAIFILPPILGPAARAPRGILEFTALPVELAWATLERIEEKGPGAKVTRPEVHFLARRVRRALEMGESVSRRP
jgi:hypothetical protein